MVDWPEARKMPARVVRCESGGVDVAGGGSVVSWDGGRGLSAAAAAVVSDFTGFVELSLRTGREDKGVSCSNLALPPVGFATGSAGNASGSMIVMGTVRLFG